MRSVGECRYILIHERRKTRGFRVLVYVAGVILGAYMRKKTLNNNWGISIFPFFHAEVELMAPNERKWCTGVFPRSVIVASIGTAADNVLFPTLQALPHATHFSA